MRWLGPARGPVAVGIGPGPWEGVAEGIGRLGYRMLLPEGVELGPLVAELGDDLTVIGQGAGAPLAVDWAAANPDRLRRAVFVAPHGVVPPEEPEPRRRLRTRLGQLPVLGQRLAARLAPPEAPLREGPHRALARSGVPVVALWAGRDAVVPIRAMGTLAQWNRGAKHEVVEGAGHDLMATHAAAVVALLRDVLREDWA